jgi:hypothetical protein
MSDRATGGSGFRLARHEKTSFLNSTHMATHKAKKIFRFSGTDCAKNLAIADAFRRQPVFFRNWNYVYQRFRYGCDKCCGLIYSDHFRKVPQQSSPVYDGAPQPYTDNKQFSASGSDCSARNTNSGANTSHADNCGAGSHATATCSDGATTKSCQRCIGQRRS